MHVSCTACTSMQVLMETLRLYPPVFGIIKQAKKGGVTLGGYAIPEGTQIMVRYKHNVNFSAVCDLMITVCMSFRMCNNTVR